MLGIVCVVTIFVYRRQKKNHMYGELVRQVDGPSRSRANVYSLEILIEGHLQVQKFKFSQFLFSR